MQGFQTQHLVGYLFPIRSFTPHINHKGKSRTEILKGVFLYRFLKSISNLSLLNKVIVSWANNQTKRIELFYLIQQRKNVLALWNLVAWAERANIIQNYFPIIEASNCRILFGEIWYFCSFLRLRTPYSTMKVRLIQQLETRRFATWWKLSRSLKVQKWFEYRDTSPKSCQVALLLSSTSNPLVQRNAQKRGVSVMKITVRHLVMILASDSLDAVSIGSTFAFLGMEALDEHR